MSEAESYHMGLFMNNLIERKYQAMNTGTDVVTQSGRPGNISRGFFSSRGGDQNTTNYDGFLMNQTLRDHSGDDVNESSVGRLP